MASSVMIIGLPIIRKQHYRFECNHSLLGGNENLKKNKFCVPIFELEKKRRSSICPKASSAVVNTRNSSPPNLYQKVLESAREKFTQEISFQAKDKDISLARALLYIAAEDESVIALNREKDALSVHSERRNTSCLSASQEWDSLEEMPLAGKNINEWLKELDTIADEVKAELVSREIGCHLGEVLEAVNLILFESRGFNRPPVLVDSKHSYLHSVLNSGCGSAILLSVIYIEVCRRLNLTILGSRVGEEFLIWPQTENPEELFKVTSGRSLFGLVNGSCVNNPRSKASDLSSKSLSGLDIATNRDIIGISLANLIRFHWKRASRNIPGLMLTSPLRPVDDANSNLSLSSSDVPLVRPKYLRLAIMASERLLILQPHNWALRRDHGMMFYFGGEYEAAVQELSICMAFAPEEESAVLEPFVEKLHLLRVESSWKSLENKGDCESHIPWASEALGSLPEVVNLWIGNEFSETSFHKDHYENNYAVVTGEKHFLLLPPTDVHRMYIRDYPAAKYCYCKNTGEFTWELEDPPRHVTWSSVDPYPSTEDREREMAKFPLYFNGPKPFEVTVKAGEILYLPNMWFHHVRQSPDSIGRTIAVNYWYDMQFDIKYAYFNFLQSIPYPSSVDQAILKMRGLRSLSDSSVTDAGDKLSTGLAVDDNLKIEE